MLVKPYGIVNTHLHSENLRNLVSQNGSVVTGELMHESVKLLIVRMEEPVQPMREPLHQSWPSLRQSAQRICVIQ